MNYCYCDTLIGCIIIGATDTAVTSLYFEEKENSQNIVENETQLLKEAKKQILEYFSGERFTFELPLEPEGTPFQKSVWKALESIAYGKTNTYGEIAQLIGSPKAARAVGMANHRNPISIIIPCHRVIGANGKLVGYGGGLDKKEKLLSIEKQFCTQRQFCMKKEK